MANNVERTELYDIDLESFYNVITDYESYPEFVDGMQEAEIIQKSKNKVRVRYKINMMKTFEYTLDHVHEEGKGISWSLVEGDLFKKSNGYWKLQETEDGLEVTYGIDVDFKMMIPSMISKKLVNKSLPAMMDSFFDRACELLEDE